MGIRSLIDGGKTAVKKAVARFPIVIILSAAAAMLTIYMTEKSMYAWEQGISRFIVVLCLGIPFYLCIYVILERINKENHKEKYLYHGLGTLMLILYWRFVYTDVSMVIVIRHIGLILILILCFLVIPYIKREENFELYIIQILSRLFITAIYAVVLQIGISAILVTLNYLLEVRIKFELYYYTWLLIVGIFAPCFFLGGIPKKGEVLSKEHYPKGLKVLMLYIIMPLISIYTMILYLYFGKIIITSKWPEGLVSHLVLWYGVISAGTLFLISKLRDTNKWADIYFKVFPGAILPLMVMMFVSIGIRIGDYGVTENRYFVVALGIWVSGTMIYLAIARKKKFIILPISLAVIMLISVCGPFSSYSISVRSQNKRFSDILKKNDMISDGSIVKSSKELSEMDKQDISSILHYFERNHALSQVKYLPKDFHFKDMKGILGFEDIEGYAYSANRFFYFGAEEGFTKIDITGYDYMFQGASYSGGGNRYGEGINADYRQQERKFVLNRDGEEIYSKAMEEYAQKLVEEYGLDNNSIKGIVKEIIFEDENDKVKIKFIFKSMSGEAVSGTNDIQNVDCEFIVLVKMK